MGNTRYRTTGISEDGEVVFEKEFTKFDWWQGDAYRYRNKYAAVKIFDDMPLKVKYHEWCLFIQIACLMNEDNLLLEMKKRSK